MANILNSLKNLSAGKSLLLINVFSTALAAATNTVAAAIDKNTSAEDKKFLIPAGIATGVANCGIYYFMTDKMIKHLENKVAPKICEILKKDGKLESSALEYVKTKISKAENGFLKTGLFKKTPEMVQSMKDTLLNGNKASADAIKEYQGTIKGFLSVAGAFAGVVIGSGILSPIIRDLSAYFVQKHMEKTNPSYKDKPYRPYFDPGHFKVGYASQKQPLNMNTYMAFTRAKNNNTTLSI